MSSDWLLVVVVLAVGALVGLFFARRLDRKAAPSPARRSRESGPRPDAPDPEAPESQVPNPEAPDPEDRLRLTDLERRRDELYEQIGRSETDADRRQLEGQAARVLRDIDRLVESTGLRVGSMPSADEAAASSGGRRAAPSTARSEAPRSTGHPMLVGFLGGATMVGLVALLIYFALRDATPDAGGPNAGGPGTSQAPAPGSSGAPAMGSEHPATPLSPQAQARLDELRQRATADPTDLVARKQLALALLATEQFFEAFQIAGELLAARPDDPDGLYVQGMVRMTMGQDDAALANLDRVLERYPNHVLALAGRGMIFMRRGDRDAAVLVWEQALEAAGGSHPDLEQLLAMAWDPDRAQRGRSQSGSSQAGSSQAEGATPEAGTQPRVAGPPAGAQEAGVAPDRFGVRVELAPGSAVPRGAILFVFLRAGETGPPAAVKRVQAPVFPLELTLGPDDSMLGQPLPDQGTITVRLDADGSASTHGEGDLSTDAAVSAGTSVRLVLGQ